MLKYLKTVKLTLTDGPTLNLSSPPTLAKPTALGFRLSIDPDTVDEDRRHRGVCRREGSLATIVGGCNERRWGRRILSWIE